MGAYHALLSPSSAFRWTDCTASVGAQAGFPNTTNQASRHGTCAHQLSAECLEHGREPSEYLGRVMVFPRGGREDWADALPGADVEFTETVTEEMVVACEAFVNFVRQRVEHLGGAAAGVRLIVEQQVPIGHITGEEGARGTSDVVIIAPHLKLEETIDAKFGRGKVTAYDVIEPPGFDPLTGEETPPKLRMNLQLALYLLGTHEKHIAAPARDAELLGDLLGDFEPVTIERVRGTIVQPYLNHVSEYECPLEELLELGEWLKARADVTRTDPTFSPSGKNCFFCKAKNTCHARNALVLETCVEGFEDEENFAPKPRHVPIPSLGKCWDMLDMIRDWCDGVEKKVTDELLAGRVVMGPDGKPMKLIEGRKGNKVWSDPEAAEKYIKTFRLGDETIYVKRLITPTEAEKLAKVKKSSKEPPPIGNLRWERLQEMIKQPDGKPEPALFAHPKPMWVKPATDMPDEPPAGELDLLS